MTRLIVVAVAVALCAGTAGAASPRIGQLTASRDGWHATLTFTKTRDPYPGDSHFHLTVKDGTRVMLDQAVTSSLPDVGSQFQPGGFGQPVLSFRDLNGDGSRELVLLLFTGGAHCCSFDQIFDFSGAKPRKTEFDFADSGAAIKVVGGKVLFASGDDSFAYAFTDYADSGEPIELRTYDAGRFTNVTRDYPSVVAKDAAFWWTQYRHSLKTGRDERGILAAWSADEALLGHAAGAKQTLVRLSATGVLNRASGLPLPKGSAYIKALWRFLDKEGYLR